MKLTDEQRQRITKAMDSVDIGKCDYLTMLAAGMRELSKDYFMLAHDGVGTEAKQLENERKATLLREIADDLEAK